MHTEWSAIVFGLASALTWGAGDFSGGLASKRTSVLVVVMVSQFVGALCLLGAALLGAEALPSGTDVVMGTAAGLFGVIGLLAFYQGLATSQMGTVASIAAATSALIPMVVGAWLEGVPAAHQLAGFGLAILAVWMMSRKSAQSPPQRRGLGLAVTAGVGFALFFICIDQTSEAAVFWPLVVGRLSAIVLLTWGGMMGGQWEKPPTHQWPIIVLAGLFDSAGNAFYALAASAGRLDMAAILASLYPAATVALAWLILEERLTRRQWAGVTTTLLAIALIAL
jgi:drug/metabolite transporter (DMT)-like permease